MTQKWYQKKVLIFPAVGLLIASASFAAGQITSSKQTITNSIVNKTEQSPSKLPPNKSVDVFDEEPITIASSFSFPQNSCGDKSTGSEGTWYPVFIDGAGIEDVRVKYCADAVATNRKDTGVKTVQLASFANRERALEFAKAVGGDVGKPTVAQANSNGEPDQPSSVGVNSGKPTISQAEIQQQQAKIQRQQTEQAILAATNLCHEKHIKAQQKTNELRKSTSGHPDNFFSDFSNSLVEGAESTAQSDLEECLQKAQTLPTP
jgi:hypothetical protein